MRSGINSLIILAFSLLFSCCTSPSPRPLLGPLGTFHLDDVKDGDVRIANTPLTNSPAREGLRISVVKAPSEPWSNVVAAITTSPVLEGEVLLAQFDLRAISTRQETGEVIVETVFDAAGEKTVRQVKQGFTAGREWRRCSIPFTALQDIPAGKGRLVIRVGFSEQTLEMANLQVSNYGKQANIQSLPRTPVTYVGREPDAAWRQSAQQRIEKIRKGELQIHIVDAQGQPIPNASVSIEMVRHQFGFGSAVSAKVINEDSDIAQRYRAIIEENFNRVVFENDLKWPEWNKPTERAGTLKALDWLVAHHIEVRGHTLVWPSWKHVGKETEVLKNDPAAMRARIDAHIREVMTATRGKILEWDVINEAVANNDVMKVLGDEEMAHWFKVAHEADPAAALFINEYSILAGGGQGHAHQDRYAAIITMLQENGAPLHGIGMQSHFGSTLTPPTRMLEILDRFAKFNCTIAGTEFDIDTTDEQLQADFMRDYLTTMFSHESVDGIVMWGFWQGRHWRPNAALWRKDFSLKPAGKVWLDLVKNKWWTRETVTTDASGNARVRGFCGDYWITCNNTSQSAQLPRTGATITLQIAPRSLP